MIQPIVKDQLFLSMKAEPMTEADTAVITDLCDTLAANRSVCAGMAANMIGSRKKCIAFFDRGMIIVMINPQIIQGKKQYETEEGCLSLSGTRRTKRYQQILVEYRDTGFHLHRKQYSGYTAQVIQHEIDHCRGILI